MTLIKRNNLFPTFDTLFDDIFYPAKGSDGGDLNTHFRTTLPSVNVRETENEFFVEVAAPGYKKDDFNVEIDNNLLTISSEKEWEQKEEDGEFNRQEFAFSTFQRRFSLPENVVNEEKINATYEDGILKLHLPKREEVKPQPKKRIEIK